MIKGKPEYIYTPAQLKKYIFVFCAIAQYTVLLQLNVATTSCILNFGQVILTETKPIQ